ncbi:hypothetical protein PC116_g20811 [Phytophthora cactorum]|nr:hypothetical protein PC116_g20811 [Phytophthora cactorum]
MLQLLGRLLQRLKTREIVKGMQRGNQVGSQKGKQKVKASESSGRTRSWGELLHLRFSDGDVKRRLESVDTKIKKALA